MPILSTPYTRSLQELHASQLSSFSSTTFELTGAPILLNNAEYIDIPLETKETFTRKQTIHSTRGFWDYDTPLQLPEQGVFDVRVLINGSSDAANDSQSPIFQVVVGDNKQPASVTTALSGGEPKKLGFVTNSSIEFQLIIDMSQLETGIDTLVLQCTDNAQNVSLSTGLVVQIIIHKIA